MLLYIIIGLLTPCPVERGLVSMAERRAGMRNVEEALILSHLCVTM